MDTFRNKRRKGEMRKKSKQKNQESWTTTLTPMEFISLCKVHANEH